MQSHVLCCPKVTILDELQERAPAIECMGHVYLTGVQFLMQIECACANVWRSAWEGDTVPCPCGPSRCTSVHMLFWSHTHLAYPGSDQVASHETPSQMIVRQIHVCCKETKRTRQQITYWFAAITKATQSDLHFASSHWIWIQWVLAFPKHLKVSQLKYALQSNRWWNPQTHHQFYFRTLRTNGKELKWNCSSHWGQAPWW